MKLDYKSSYKILKLTPSSNWPQAKSSYRRLVQIWHPDRHSESSPNYASAHQNFLDITKAFEELQDFYRTNGKLPYEPETLDQTEFDSLDSDTITLSRRASAKARKKHASHKGAAGKLSFIIGLAIAVFLVFNSDRRDMAPFDAEDLDSPATTGSQQIKSTIPDKVHWNKQLDYDINNGHYLGTSSTSVGDTLGRRMSETRR